MSWCDWVAADLPTWLQGIGTVGTLGIAVFVLKREQDDRRERDHFDKRRQARRISVAKPRYAGVAWNDGGDAAWHVDTTVSNQSDETVDKCRVRVMCFNEADGERSEKPWADKVVEAGRLTAGQSRDVTAILPRPPRVGSEPAPYESELLFTDAAGVRWHRDTEHELREVSGNYPW